MDCSPIPGWLVLTNYRSPVREQHPISPGLVSLYSSAAETTLPKTKRQLGPFVWLCDYFLSPPRGELVRTEASFFFLFFLCVYCDFLFTQLYFPFDETIAKVIPLCSLVNFCSVLTSLHSLDKVNLDCFSVDASVLICVCANWMENLLREWENLPMMLAGLCLCVSAWTMKDLRFKKKKITTCRDCGWIALMCRTWYMKATCIIQLRRHDKWCNEPTPTVPFTLKNSSLETEKSVCF